MWKKKRSAEENGITSTSIRTRGQSRYSSPMDELDTRTRKWKPNKVRENNNYEQLCQRGECRRFEVPPSSYQHFFINKKSTCETLDDLIEYARQVTAFTVDTENQLQPAPRQSLPALIQIEFIHPYHSPTIILVETLHLPAENSSLFIKIRELCRTIFSHNNVIYSWGTLNDELGKFYRFNLFDENDVEQVKVRNIQDEFKRSYHTKYPSSTFVKAKATEKYSLQLAMYISFNQWLDKRMTLSNWGCGIDLSLNTFRTISRFHPSYKEQVEIEEEYQRLMTTYAVHDCFAVTQLANKIDTWNSITPPTTIEEEEYLDDERMLIDDERFESTIELHPTSEDLPLDHPTIDGKRIILWSTNEPNMDDPTINYLGQSSRSDERSTVHVLNEPTKFQRSQEPLNNVEPITHISSEEGDNVRWSPETTKIHLEREPRRSSTESTNSPNTKIHVRNESSEVDGFFSLGHRRKPMSELTPQQRRNRKTNDRLRAKRYTFEVIRKIYPLFNITKVKRILKSMNIFYVNINIVGHTLFIGVKTQDVANEVEYQLNDRLFTKQHYYRLYPKNE